jgi:organic radical activating enzyme
MIAREKLYRFPWSKTDNPGGWVEVTDNCNLNCTGCYRNKIEGHRNVDAIKKDIDDLIRFTNCDSICVAGGEPLGYPQIVEVVRYISSKKVKPMISSNGVFLTPELARDLRDAGLAKIHFHIDSTQNRPGWEGKSEIELNELRLFYADLLWKTKKIQCGYHVTITRSSIKYIPEILKWGQQNIKKVHHISFLAFRAVVNDPEYILVANGKVIDHEKSFGYNPTPDEVNITTEELYEYVLKENVNLRPSAYLNGTTAHETYKFLIIVNVGSTGKHLGVLGAKTMELSQAFYHLFNGRYFAFLQNPNPGKILFLASFFDKEVRKTFASYLKSSLKNPLRLFNKIYLQSIHLQQPSEIINGRINLCDDCVNMLVYKGQLINACRLDEYRMFGGPMEVIKQGHFSYQ